MKNWMQWCARVGLVMSGVAHAEVARDAADWQASSEYSAGQAVVRPANGGRYIYGAPRPDGRDTHGVRYTAGRPDRARYTLFSAQEEDALWRLRDQKREAAEKVIADAEKAKAKTRRHHVVLDWPKVVSRGASICVPQSGFGNSSDWKQHLLCWKTDTRHVDIE